MTAKPPETPVTEAVCSLEVRWIFPGRLPSVVAGWFGRFPARTGSREDTYLLDPQLPGLSVKISAGQVLEVKAYRGSPGILKVTGCARGRLESWQKWSFPFSPPSPGGGAPAGWRPVRKKRRISRFSSASGQIRARAPRLGRQQGCEVNSPRSAQAARTGGPWDSRRPAPQACSAANCRPPPRWCSPRPCPVVWNPARMNPGPTRNGCPSGRAARMTPTPDDCPSAEPAGPPFCSPRPAPAQPGTPEATSPPPITSRLSGWHCQCMTQAKYTVDQLGRRPGAAPRSRRCRSSTSARRRTAS
jgi:hypothetical protein